ncbi:hypothetical protein [Micromonospora sp. GCM10011541]|uniref:hypothetical protein n=1 Tax=Micromonospora sp. GCM10011541 TaxID=3317336 RepID=UPI0036199268
MWVRCTVPGSTNKWINLDRVACLRIGSGFSPRAILAEQDYPFSGNGAGVSEHVDLATAKAALAALVKNQKQFVLSTYNGECALNLEYVNQLQVTGSGSAWQVGYGSAATLSLHATEAEAQAAAEAVIGKRNLH